MPITKNAVYFENNGDSISFVIKMVHPRLYKLVFASLCALSIIGTLSLVIIFDIFALLGPSSLLILMLGMLISFGFFKIYIWHHSGEEFFLLTSDNLSYQINNGLKLSDLKSYEAMGYQIGFQETNSYESETCGRIYFFTMDPKTKLSTIILYSTLEITFEEYQFLLSNYLKISQKQPPLSHFSLN
ncbi:hypothetical protein [Sphingobacterium sp. BIGb0165]|uniref:hypothetical protein n=1 Tax=Sphingobacterium sp. BIGb0165 TaxID=2940615 RepID=UPI0021696F03|nr:hypothetical protein [Sphingobacterium sp. BIGb0165]MCS4228805.1 hypothetical protein [Sphingobacterium sp. BIGb0165]